MNALKTGLSAGTTLLPNESREEYEAVVGAWMEGLGPNTLAEQRLVVRIADADWRLQRVARVERQIILDAVDAAVAKSDLTKLLARDGGVRQAVAGLATMPEVTSLANQSNALDSILPAIRTLAHSVAELELPGAAVGRLLAVARDLAVEDLVGDPDVPWKELGRTARALEQDLIERIGLLELKVASERQRLLDEHSVGSDREAKRLERRRSALQRELDAALGTFSAVRALS